MEAWLRTMQDVEAAGGIINWESDGAESAKRLDSASEEVDDVIEIPDEKDPHEGRQGVLGHADVVVMKLIETLEESVAADGPLDASDPTASGSAGPAVPPKS